jgi:hypothetical protein
VLAWQSIKAMMFFDGIVNTPEEEISLCMHRANSSRNGDATSVQGRASCLLRVGTHALSMGIKPLMYAGYWSASQVSVAMVSSMDPDDPGFRTYAMTHPDEAKAVVMLIENEELRERNLRLLDKVPLCALVSPVTQAVQVLKAAGGIIHPGVYYQNDPFLPIFAHLAEVASEVGCSQELVGALKDGPDLIKVNF